MARRRVLARLPYFYAAPDLIAGSDMVMTLPTRAAVRLAESAGLHHCPAPVEIAGFTYSLLWHEHNVRDPATMWLADMLAAACLHPSGA